MQITATIGSSTLSRADANEVEGDHDVWAADDRIGITATVGTVVGPFINYEYKTTGDGKFSGKPLFFYKPMTLTAYYPYTGEDGKLPGIIDVNTGAAYQTKENRPKIDFLWDTKTGVDKKDFSLADPNVEFTFAHKMSKLTFWFQSSKPVFDERNPDLCISDGVDVHTMISYQVEGLGIKGTFDTATGECTIGENEREGLKISFDKETTADGEPDYEYIRKMSPLVVLPQTKPAKDFVLHITTDELKEGSPTQDYKCVLRFGDNEI